MDPSKSFAGFENPLLWQISHQFAHMIYEMTHHFPYREKFGLTSQLRWTAVPIPANSAQRYGKRSKADKARFYNVAQRSMNGRRHSIRLAKDLGDAQSDSNTEQINEIGRVLTRFARKVAAF